MSDDDMVALLAYYRSSPVAFAEDMLGLIMTPWQAECLMALAVHSRVAMRSGHKVGKSTMDAVAALWFWTCFDGARVVLTAPTWHQVEKILWREVDSLYKAAPVDLGGKLYDTPHKGLVFDATTGLDKREIFGLSVKDHEAFSGVSGANVLYIIDEASGVGDNIFEAIEGNAAAKGTKRLLTGNPTQQSGEFFQAFHTKRSFYNTHHVSSRQAVEYQEQVRTVPGLAWREWLDQKDEEWGVGSATHDIRVEGNFPKGGTINVIALMLINAASERWKLGMSSKRQPIEAGLDVARDGDDETCLAICRGNFMYPLIVMPGERDSHAIARRAVNEISAIMHTNERPMIPGYVKPKVKVDVIGWGAGTFDVLKNDYSHVVEAIEVNVAKNADTTDEHHRLRDQLWFGVADWLKEGQLPPDEKLAEELLAPRYSFDSQGRYQVESKKEMKKADRLGRSPDRADAVGLAVYKAQRYRARVGHVRGI